jgi:hypothetical protein
MLQRDPRCMTCPEWNRERLIVCFDLRPAPLKNPHPRWNIIQGFQKLQIASAVRRISETIKRFRLLKLRLTRKRPSNLILDRGPDSIQPGLHFTVGKLDLHLHIFRRFKGFPETGFMLGNMKR